MNRIDRLNALLIHLQGKPRVPLSELEERFEIGRRTVFRDIRSLIDAGVPIGGDAGDGYFIVEGYHLPPVVFNKEEACAILIGAKFIERSADTQTIDTFNKAMYKIKAVLKYSDKEFLDNLEDRIAIRPGPVPAKKADSHLAEIQLGIATNRVLSISYYAHHSDTSTQRDVEPLGMVFYSNHWHLIAFCRLRQDLRDFRADRIEKVSVLANSFEPTDHPNYMDFLNEALIGTDAKEAIIRVTSLVSRFMGEQKYYMGFVEETKLEDGRYEMKFVPPHYDYFAHWLMMFGNEVDILSPSELQGIAATISKELLEHHSKPFLND